MAYSLILSLYMALPHSIRTTLYDTANHGMTHGTTRQDTKQHFITRQHRMKQLGSTELNSHSEILEVLETSNHNGTQNKSVSA